ncbi:acyltransferase [Sphingomonas sp. HDW15A]|uniref:acyltransferase family protein n=1 Tax=Sphingomonas sp. HDW15A TaxID=2714942 RepID=UPI001409B500|nr:acyltransferase [Sphingomonas sp. HDW15A]QIK95840.1 acyltransferase [Sphingomonas sp. HDW15A]
MSPAAAQIKCLQAGRAIAALAVVLHHAQLAARDFGAVNIPMLEHGYLGVDFFFVLSGFIIAHSVSGKTLGEYVWHRFRRVFLPYLPVGVAFALLYTALPSVSAGDRTWSWLATLTLLPIGDPALSVAWTLQHEVVFYAVFAAMLVTRNNWLLIIWAAAIILAPTEWLPFRSINLEFLFGVICHRWQRNWAIFPLAILPFSLWLYLGAPREASWLFGASLALVLPALLTAERGGMRIPRWLVWTGGASYSIYLAHGLAISVVARIYPALPALVLAGTLTGIAYFLLVERPLLSLIPKSPPSSFLR